MDMDPTLPVENGHISSVALISSLKVSDNNMFSIEDKNVEDNNVSHGRSKQENIAVPGDTEANTTTFADPVSCLPESISSFGANANISSPKFQTAITCCKEVKQTDEDSIASTSQTFCTESSTKSSELLDTEYLRAKYDPMASSSKDLDGETQYLKRKSVSLYGPDVGSKMYKIKGNLVTPPIIANNLPKIFDYLPVFGKPKSKDDLENFYSSKIREFVGFDMNDEQFDKLAKMCSPEHLRTGNELVMSTPYPTLSMLSVIDKDYDLNESNLCIVKKHQLRLASDPCNNYYKRLKYRGIRLMPLTQMEIENEEELVQDLEPGKDVIYRIRIYRPFPHNIKEKQVSTRHSIFSRDVVAGGRTRLSALRDRLVCANDAGVRLDASVDPKHLPTACAKELFPSGFLFINNVFYVDARGRCADRSAPLRAWAAARGLGDFPRETCTTQGWRTSACGWGIRRANSRIPTYLHETRLEDICVWLGHPEARLEPGYEAWDDSILGWDSMKNTLVYVHQGNCEHLFTFSEIRLLSADDPLSSSQYPCHTAVSQHQSVYCTTCAEFGAKWIVTGCVTVPFDPAFFCDTCLKMYLYKDNKKMGDFKAYSYRGNEINVLKPQG
ncbi:hypothetical protein MSG28_012519 [Choristoneura fumiferana]|uniref:Uncharacterized protein n=1 Tax=Choristoneura fumiferana TaxID=7141 RepID=A0ACC0KDY2_CHOFU|nr:hypothetical protein MSG28_012519 [Choristoneura fumiferana]